MTDYILNGVLGLAVGDALGQSAQGKTRESLKFSPVLEMKQGLWSDDTSLTLCTLASLRKMTGGLIIMMCCGVLPSGWNMAI